MMELGEKDTKSGKYIFSTARTLPTAKAFLEDRFSHPETYTLRYYAGEWWRFVGSRYVPVEHESMSAMMTDFLHDSVTYTKDGDSLYPFPANPASVNAALETTKNRCHVSAGVRQPSWLHTYGYMSPDPKGLVVCKTHLLDIATRQKIMVTPRLFTTTALEFDYDPEATCPNFCKFLDNIWGSDDQQKQLLLEWFGYCLTPDTSRHKMLLIFGPRRSGKGTIGRILSRLVGQDNVAGPTVDGLSQPFGLAGLIGKPLALVSDARFNGQNISTVVERLLCISGEDAIEVNSKHKNAITLRLPTRFMFLSNEMPRMSEASNALTGRFLILRTTNSYYDREDLELEKRLCNELPGILRMSLDALDRLRERGKFIKVDSCEESIEEMEDLASPISAFVRDNCELGESYYESPKDLYESWKKWCKEMGRDHIGSLQTFCRDLRAAVPTMKIRQHETKSDTPSEDDNRVRKSTRARFYDGIRVRIDPDEVPSW